MKQTILLALALLASASFCTIDAAKKKKTVKVMPEQTAEALLLTNGSDSVSYAGGINFSEGLVNYLLQQGMDTTLMADFILGFEEAVKGEEDAQAKAKRLGTEIGRQVMNSLMPGISRELTDTPDSIVPNLFYRGFTDALLNDTTTFTTTAAHEYFRQKMEWNKSVREEKLYGETRKAGEQFLEENAKQEGVITLPSGLQYKVLVQGDGEVPLETDRVKVNYEGRLIDGTVFDASANHGTDPATFSPAQVIKGWTEALTMMPVGSKWQIYIPYNLAYGERGAGEKIKPYSALVFDIELVGIDRE